MIIVTGATGQLGRASVEHLLERVPASEVGVSVRDPERAQDLADRGVRVRRGDFTDPSTLAAAFEGATQVLLVSGPAGAESHVAAVDAAVAAGARRVVYTSHMAAGATPAPLFAPAVGHAETERHLERSAVASTALRDGFHATSALPMLGRGVETGELRLPEGGPVCWTAQDDLGVAAAVALTEPERLSGTTPPLTGSELLDMDEVADVVAELTGRPLRRTTVSDESFLAERMAAGMPEAYARLALTFFTAGRRGDFAATDPALADLLGREPVRLRDVLAAQLGVAAPAGA
ncbi:NAD(P)H-binding protein [Pseudokineococcus marinus]|uniref:NAD(P)H-binding protein n=1 Tax=Pseudokineococcus marinus TaxID=351215 RepID=A0A849BN68_9ACTN|nr:NAD(P)H-binding protein [Pseudokineococcus marinus]NNH22487.1 NAD(P)H-binding protein [Pseudokineococcus marinus]